MINNQFIFSDIFFSDTKFNSRGELNGIITHTNFKNWLLDLNIDSERLLVLNTKDVDNPVYYGTAFVSGDISIAGPGESLKFMANVSSEKGTIFNIPLNDSKDFTENISYIKFANKRTNNITDNSIFNKINGIELDFDLNLNRNAEIEILIDRSSGSTIKGYGDGNLIMEINNKGKFNIINSELDKLNAENPDLFTNITSSYASDNNVASSMPSLNMAIHPRVNGAKLSFYHAGKLENDEGFKNMMIISVFVSLISMLIGIYSSFWIDSAPAPTVILVLTIIFILAFILKTNRQKTNIVVPH